MQQLKGPLRGPLGIEEGSDPAAGSDPGDHNSGTSNSATMLMILISGLMAGPAVSL